MTSGQFVEWTHRALPPLALSRIRMRLLKELMDGSVNLDDPKFLLSDKAIKRLTEVVQALYQVELSDGEMIHG